MRRLFILVALLFLVAGCQQGKQHNEYRAFTDDYHRVVQIPVEPQRIVSLSPAVSEIIFALGQGDRLVGRTDYCSYPEQVAELPSIGGITNLNVEQVLGLNPDVVIGASMVPQKCVAQFEKVGVPVVCIPEKQHFFDLYDNIAKIGQVIGSEKAADSLVAVLKSQVSGLDTNLGADCPTIYYVVGYGSAGNYTAGGNTHINDIIRMAGGRNIAEDVEGWSYSLEALMQADPDYILIRKGDEDGFVNTAPYSQLKAVKEGRVIPIESGWIDLQVPRNIQAVRLLSGILAR